MFAISDVHNFENTLFHGVSFVKYNTFGLRDTTRKLSMCYHDKTDKFTQCNLVPTKCGATTLLYDVVNT